MRRYRSKGHHVKTVFLLLRAAVVLQDQGVVCYIELPAGQRRSAHARIDVISFLLFPEKKRKYEVGGTRTHDIYIYFVELPTGPRSHL